MGLVLLNEDLEIQLINETGSRLLKSTKEQLQGKTFAVEVPPNRIQKDLNAVGYIKDVGTSVITRDKVIIHLVCDIEVIKLDDRVYWLASMRDITSQKEWEKEQLENYQRLTNYLGNSPLGFVEYDVDLTVKEWSVQCEKIFKWTRSEILQHKISAFNLIYEEDYSAAGKIAEDLLSGRVSGNISINRNYTKDGNVITCVWYNSIVKDASGRVTSVMSLVQDITEQTTMERHMKELSQRLMLAIDSASLGIFDWKTTSEYFNWNDHMCRMHGLGGDVIKVTLRQWCSAILRADRRKFDQEVQRSISTGSSFQCTYRVKTAQGLRHMELHALLTDSGSQQTMIGVCYDITQRVNYEKELMKAILKTQEEDRRQLGQELHDNIVQLLTVSYLNLENLRSIQPQEASKVSGFINQAIEATRRLSHQLAPSELVEKSLVLAISELTDHVESGTAMHILFDHELDLELSLHDDLGLNFYRILQEQLNNIIKHSKASNVDIRLQATKEAYILITKDDGVGFDIGRSKKGMGMANIRRRVELFNGDVTVDSSPGEGCAYKIQIPRG